MKKLYVFSFWMSLICLSSCDFSSREASPNNDALLKVLSDNGFSTEGIIDKGDFFIVEGDMRFDKSYLQDFTSQKQNKDDQNRFLSLVSSSKIGNITIGVDAAYAALGQQWITAVQAAATSWSTSGSKIKITYVGTVGSGGADIIVYKWDGNPGFYGYAGVPSSGLPYHTIYIAHQMTSNTGETAYPTQISKNRLVEHEIGHTIGFAHTGANIGWDPHYQHTPVQCTPPEDAPSVMNIGNPWTWTTSGLSYWDKEAAKMVYPKKWAYACMAPAELQAM